MSRTRGSLYPILFLTLVVLVSVVALTLTNGITVDRIDEARRDAVTEMLQALFPEMDKYREEGERFAVLGEGSALGTAFMAEPMGYGGPIEILVGLNVDETLRGIQVISQKETPGLGAKIIEDAFLAQFSGLTVDGLALAKDGGEIDAITGATISSAAVTEGVRAAALRRLGQGGED